MNPRSIRFRLIIWYAGLLTGVFLLFGVALYQVLRGYLEHSLAQTLVRRSEQIAVIAPGKMWIKPESITWRIRSRLAMRRKTTIGSFASPGRMAACFTPRAGGQF